MYKSLFIASLEPLDKEGWNDLLDWTDSEIAEAIPYADSANLITDANFHANDLAFFKYLTVENYDESNLLVTISEENRQKCRNWKADVYRRYADNLEAGKPDTQDRWIINAIEQDADFFLPLCLSLDIYSDYSEDLPDKFYVCRNMYYLYNM